MNIHIYIYIFTIKIIGLAEYYLNNCLAPASVFDILWVTNMGTFSMGGMTYEQGMDADKPSNSRVVRSVAYKKV